MQLKNLLNSNKHAITLPNSCSFFFGLLLKFSFNENGCFVCTIISFLILFFLLRKNKSKSFIIGYSFGLGYFISTLVWMPASFKCVDIPIIYGYLSLLILSVFMSLFVAIPCYFYTKLSLYKFGFSIFYSFFEYLRGIIFPWNLIGYTAYKIPYFCQVADIVGAYGVTFLILLIIELVYNRKIKYAIFAYIIISFYGFYKINLSNNCIVPTTQLDVTLVHPNIGQKEKLNPKLLWNNIDLHLELSLGNNNLVIWPETAINMFFNKYILQYLPKNEMIIGSNRLDNNAMYNSLFVLYQNEIVQIYDKQHLVPFGEYIPNWICTIINTIVPNSVTCGFSKGKLKKSISKYNCAANICYEIIFPSRVIDDKHNTWILNLTNDGWFDMTDEPYQHLISSCFRAIEEGKSIARCNNMGISCFIDCYGDIVKKITKKSGSITYKMPQKYVSTVYSKYGNTVFLLLLIALFLFTTSYKYLLRKKQHSNIAGTY